MKKIIFSLIVCLFAAGSIINMHLAENNHNMDVSLADISVMAQADGESGGNELNCCPNQSDCNYKPGYLCVWCGYGLCDPIEDYTEGCGLADKCWY